MRTKPLEEAVGRPVALLPEFDPSMQPPAYQYPEASDYKACAPSVSYISTVCQSVVQVVVLITFLI